jgi:hypothetical protein
MLSPCLCSEEIKCRAILPLNLLHGAVVRIFVWAPAKEFGSVPESSAGEVIELHFHHQLGNDRLPFSRTIRAPSAGAAGRLSAEARLFHDRFQLLG